MTAGVTAGDSLLAGVLEAVTGRGPLQLGLHLPEGGGVGGARQSSGSLSGDEIGRAHV
mgnify:CR=1 FL=1